MDFLLKLLVLELGIAFERQPIDDRGFDHRDHQPAAGLGDADILKQARGVKRLQRGVDLGGVDALAGADFEVGADGFSFDTAVAFDDDRGRGRLALRMRNRCRKERDAKQCHAEEQAGHD